MSLAQAEATALSTEYGKFLADIKVCSQCEEAALFVAAEFKQLNIKATAAAEVKLKGAAQPGKPAKASVDEFVTAYSAAFIVDFGKVCPGPCGMPMP